MRAMWTAVCGLAAVAAAGAGAAVAQDAAAKAPKSVKVTFLTHDGKPGGTATLKPAKDGGVKLTLNLKGMTFGQHGVHIHQNATCEGPDFKTAGGHFNPTAKKHGFENAEGHHAGDLPKNVDVGEDHNGSATFTLTDVTLTPGAPNSLFANGGTSIVVHEKADDMKTDPSGNSGNRIACAVVKMP